MAAEKGRNMGNAVGCPTEWAEEMEESFISTFSSIFLYISPLSFSQSEEWKNAFFSPFLLFSLIFLPLSPFLSLSCLTIIPLFFPQQECLLLLPVEALIKYKGDFSQSATSMGAVDDFAPDPVLPLPYKEAISQGIGPQV